MKPALDRRLLLHIVFAEGLLLLLCIHESSGSPLEYYLEDPSLVERSMDAMVPKISPTVAPQPFLPHLAPSPLAPFTNNTIPRLSGLCTLNFSAAESLMGVTSTDCQAFFAPFLANVMCCPQLEATLTVLVGKYSKDTKMLALNETLAKHCLSDIEQILVGQGASGNLRQICSVSPSNLTEASCPVKDVNEFESTVDSTKLLSACEKIDPVKECCEQVCQNAISEAATKISSKASGLLSMNGSPILPERPINDCKRVVLRWLASKLDPSRAKEVMRGLSNCNVNKVCPLVFPDTRHVAKGCQNGISNQTACCSAMDRYISHLQKQSFITNLQALDCASTLGMKLQQLNITKNVYRLCHISLKDFSLQVGNQEAGCLLPSLPSDATFDQSSGISFLCDLNDNIPAPWPSKSQLPASSCNRNVNIPALPAAASGQCGRHSEYLIFYLILISLMVLMVLS